MYLFNRHCLFGHFLTVISPLLLQLDVICQRTNQSVERTFRHHFITVGLCSRWFLEEIRVQWGTCDESHQAKVVLEIDSAVCDKSLWEYINSLSERHNLTVQTSCYQLFGADARFQVSPFHEHFWNRKCFKKRLLRPLPLDSHLTDDDAKRRRTLVVYVR